MREDKVNILLVDDQPAKLLTYEAILGELGENLIKANSGEEALEHLLRTDIAVVLVDVCMPKLDGFELAALIRQHPRYQDTAIIFISAVHLTNLDQIKGYKAGAVDYVSVPVDPELLRARVTIFADLYRKTGALERLNRDLERRVAERTAELQADIAERKRTAERLLEQEKRLTYVSRLGVLGELAAGIAHEINQPLTAIATYAQASRRLLTGTTCDKEELLIAFNKIERQVLRAGEVIRGLRAFTRPTEGNRRRVNLRDLLSEVLQLAQMDARAHDTRIKLTTHPRLPQVTVDVIQIQQVVLNLVRNAIEAMACTPVVKRIVNVDVAQINENDLRVAVSDRGEGLTPEVRDNLFTPFFTTKAQGMGIGLSLCRSIINAHGGQIQVENRTGGGATFSFTLPTAAGERADT
ncbi:MAG TPA: ATP-binding protein [Gammaproteobacteria bacterium]|nr:ATP-binding protein [Gammaproteobacteria bacterium]